MSIFLLGGSGRLGRALANELASESFRIVDRQAASDWALTDGDLRVSSYFRENPSSPATVIVASGLLNPRGSRDLLDAVNYWLPRNVIRGAEDFGHRVITFGTVFEEKGFPRNAYIESKIRLSDFIAELSASRKVSHLRLHTLYGVGEPSPFMFLGQLASAIRERRPFDMSSGLQIREFHHFADDAKAVRLLLGESADRIVKLSHGESLTLREVAEYVLRAFGQIQLLNLNSFQDPECENYSSLFEKNPIFERVPSRKSLPSVLQYLKRVT